MTRELRESEFPVRRSPWGTIDSAYRYADGITQVNTPGHGGFHLSRARLRAMPEYFRAECAQGSFFEEDCAWAVVAITFPEAFAAKDLESAVVTLIGSYPDLYERHYGVTIEPGQSHTVDARAFRAANVDNFVVSGAWGDWEETTPKGMVKVFARKESTGEEKYFLVAAAEYDARRYSFVIGDHAETTPAKGGSTKQVAVA